MSICCGRFCSTLAYGLWCKQMFMQCVCNVRSYSCNYVLVLSMYAIHLYLCLFLIRCLGAHEFDNKFLLNQSINSSDKHVPYLFHPCCFVFQVVLILLCLFLSLIVLLVPLMFKLINVKVRTNHIDNCFIQCGLKPFWSPVILIILIMIICSF